MMQGNGYMCSVYIPRNVNVKNIYIYISYVQYVNIDISIHILLMFQKSTYSNQLRLLVVEIYHYFYGPGFIHPFQRVVVFTPHAGVPMPSYDLLKVKHPK